MNKNRYLLSVFLTFLALVGLVACGGTQEAGPSTTSTANQGAGTWPLTVTDSKGQVTIPAKPSRIVSLSPTATEQLFAISAGPQVVAVDKQSTFPPQAPKTALDGYQPNVEAIRSYNPDLVVLAYDPNSLTQQLRDAKVPVITLTTPSSLAQAYDQLRLLGQVTGNSSQAELTATAMRTSIEQLTSTVSPPNGKPLRVYVETEAGSSYYTPGVNSYMGDLLRTLHLANIADPAMTAGADANYPSLSSEAIIKANPQLIVLTNPVSAAAVAARPGWSSIEAVRHREHSIITVEADLASRWGPRLVQAAQVIAAAATHLQTAH